MVELSATTRAIAAMLFTSHDLSQVVTILERDCADNLPGCETFDSAQLERIRFAALKCAAGSLHSLYEAVALAQTDWRDLLMTAGFGHALDAHATWAAEVLGSRQSDHLK